MGRRAENRGIDEDFGPSTELSELLLSPEEAHAMQARGGTDAAVLVPLHGWPDEPGLIFTERRADMRRHAGEISFPGGRRDEGDADLVATALREAEEEIGLDPAAVELSGALPPASTFVTGYRIHPYVGLIPHPAELDLEPNPSEVETVLAFSLEGLRAGYAMRRLVRRGVPIHTPTYEVDGHLIWGATARSSATFWSAWARRSSRPRPSPIDRDARGRSAGPSSLQ
jgi:8-oxo-dGTP pyrophosphatase MutT (NUDIX family)